MDELLQKLQEYGLQSDDQGILGQDIVRALDKAAAHGGDEIKNSKPPLDLVIFALKRILFPSFEPQLMSEFLHLFTMVEFFRQKITDKASRLLVWDTYYKQEEDPRVSLTAEERLFCESLDENQEDLRKIYLNVILQCCVVDLTRLWLLSSNTDFWIRFNEYFSVLKDEETDKIRHTFQYKMTSEEKSFLHEAACEVSEFIETTIRWAGDQSGRGQSIQDVFESENFHEEFPVPELSVEFFDSIAYQLEFVQDAEQRISLIKGL